MSPDTSVDVFLTAIKMVYSYGALSNRSRQIRAMSNPDVEVRSDSDEKVEGYSLTDKEKEDVTADRLKLQAEWKTWEQQAIVNL